MIVAVVTVGEPGVCEATVRALLRQRLPTGTKAAVLVVDNNRRSQPYRVPDEVAVVHEPTPGISAARNAAVEVALDRKSDVLAFIDDDELPVGETWLAALVNGLASLPADVTTGPVIPAFDEHAPTWIRAHSLFHRRRYPTGTVRSLAATGNVAIRTDVFRASGCRFDERLGLVGGEDTDWSRRVVEAGATIRWVDEAEVRERVPLERTTVRWVFRRSWRLGTNRVQRRRVGTPGEKPLPVLVGGALIETLFGALGGLLFAIPSRRLALVSLSRAARGIGCLVAVVGVEYQEYGGRSIA